MKKGKRWFSLVEVIVWTVLLAITSIWIVWIYNSLMDRDVEIDYTIKSIYFNQFTFDLINWLEIPSWPIWSNYYIKTVSENTYEINQNPRNNTDKMNFFDSDDESVIRHEINLISINKIEWIDYKTYKIYTQYNQDEKTSYLTK